MEYELLSFGNFSQKVIALFVCIIFCAAEITFNFVCFLLYVTRLLEAREISRTLAEYLPKCVTSQLNADEVLSRGVKVSC